MFSLKRNLFRISKKISAIVDINTRTLLLIFVFLAILLLPIIFSFYSFFSLTSFDQNTGVIGDTIGGITSPFVNFLGAYLVYLALKEQIKANKIITRQLRKEKIDQNQILYFSNFSNQLDRIKKNLTKLTFDGKTGMEAALTYYKKCGLVEYDPNFSEEFKRFSEDKIQSRKLIINNLILFYKACNYVENNTISDVNKTFFYLELIAFTSEIIRINNNVKDFFKNISNENSNKYDKLVLKNYIELCKVTILCLDNQKKDYTETSEVYDILKTIIKTKIN